MKKRILALVIMLVMVLSLGLSGCGSSAPAASESKPADGGAAAPAADGAKLVYWSMWEATEPQGMVLQEAINAFTAETGIPVDVQFKGRQGIRQGLQAALDANTVIDIFDEGVDRVNQNWGDYLLDLEGYVKDSGYEATAIAPFMAACREAGGGTLKSIPYQGSIFAWFYNPDIFKEAGIAAPPTTWDEFLDCCAKIKAAGYSPITSDDAYFLSNFGYHVARYGGQEAVLDAVENGKWDSEPVRKAAEDFYYLGQQGYFSPNMTSNVWPNGQNVEFALGEVGMYLNGSWLPNEIRGLAGDDYVWGCFSYPAVAGGKDDTSYANTSFQVFAINKSSQYPDEAFKLIEFLTKGEWDLKLSQGSLGVPADTTNTEWPAQMINVKPVLEGTANRYIWAAGAENNADITPVLLENLFNLCSTKITPDEFVSNMLAASK
jgi:raffinose/stachyose/melibiose transport system substrate-binding protein